MAFTRLLVAGCLVGGAVGVACGGGTGAASGAVAPAGAAPDDEGPSGKSPPADFKGPMTPIMPTAMAAELQAMGLDIKALPPLEKMDPKTLRKVMKTFTKSLGARCGDCHMQGDFAAPTPMKEIALQMWNRFVVALAADGSEGGPLYCDSCHQQRIKMLDTSNKKALSKWMQDNYVDKLKRKDGGEHECSTCHGDPFEGDIFANVWHIRE